MVVLPRLVDGFASKHHGLMGAEVNTTETGGAVGTSNGQRLLTLTLLHGDVADGTYSCAGAAAHTEVCAYCRLERLYHLLPHLRVHREPTKQVPPAEMIG